jgi:hypothetical protein
MSTRQIRIAVVFTLLVAACATTTLDEYKDIEEAMSSQVQPFVDELLVTELNKDADKTDFAAIRRSAMIVRTIFIQAGDPERVLYLKSAKFRKAARTAESWFRDIATAATLKRHDKLVALYKRKPTICTSCHDEY